MTPVSLFRKVLKARAQQFRTLRGAQTEQKSMAGQGHHSGAKCRRFAKWQKRPLPCKAWSDGGPITANCREQLASQPTGNLTLLLPSLKASLPKKKWQYGAVREF